MIRYKAYGSTSRLMNSPRYPWIDWLKSLGILLVVVGHTPLPESQHRLIYSFHMPLFFMISGFLIAPGGWSLSVVEFVRRRLTKLVKLYFLFGLLGMVVYFYMFRNEQTLQQMLEDRIRALFYASASFYAPRDLFPVVLWYFPALITGLSLTYLAWQVRPPLGKVGAVAAIVTIGALLHGRALPWELESGCFAAGFIALGHCARLYQWDEWAGKVAIPVSIVALAAGIGTALLNPDTLDIRAAHLGTPWLSITAALLLIVALTCVFKRLRASRLLAAVSAATILIFPTHTMTFPYMDRIAMKLPFLRDAVLHNAPWFSWSKAGFVVIVTVLLHAAYRHAGRLSTSWKRGSHPLS